MFRCEFSGKMSQPGERCNKVVAKRRKVEYSFRSKINKRKNEEGRTEWTPDKGGTGYEIVKEISVRDECLENALTWYTFERTISDHQD